MQWIDSEAVKALLQPAIKGLPRGGQTAMARALGVEPQTVNKWAKGQTTPTPDRWEEVETYLSMTPGSIAVVAGLSLTPETRLTREQIFDATYGDSNVGDEFIDEAVGRLGDEGRDRLRSLRENPELYPWLLDVALQTLARRVDALGGARVPWPPLEETEQFADHVLQIQDEQFGLAADTGDERKPAGKSQNRPSPPPEPEGP